jgi:hypothetical protein
MGTWEPIPTNVYGGFDLPCDLRVVLAVLKPLFVGATSSIAHISAETGSLVLRSDRAFFHTLFMGEEDGYLFDGGVVGSLEDRLEFVKRMSSALENAGIEHELHVADGPMNYVASFPESKFAPE